MRPPSEDFPRIQKMYQMGMTVSQIARTYRTTDFTTIRRYRPEGAQENLKDYRAKYGNHAIVDRMEVITLWRAGWTVEKIAGEVGTDPDIVWKILIEMQAAFESVGEL